MERHNINKHDNNIGEAKRNSRISSARRRQHSAFGISSLECPAVFCSKTLPKDEEGPSVLPSPCSSEASRPFNCLLISNVSTIVQFSQFTEPFNPYRSLETPHSDIFYMLIFYQSIWSNQFPIYFYLQLRNSSLS
ncbi:uncharacterized protein LOC100578184 isoform X2 [Apis mellifera]|uniref:Uncharacterized protein LOC100578184 isoform X2 n=1 Tax=Apis mellifera TaxID=7460 RepID=A0A7M7IJ78_APIME|nr:uncharacterized protein LOC100578184 isoform X2 [Apis mellifera]|eukprot:XP_016771773.2 uncharacterized protein LOC100578184 isoform X2 [Apis mellifera]